MPHARRSIRRTRISLKCEKTRFRGVGLKENVALGEFYAELTVDNHSYRILIPVVSNDMITHKFIVGTDFLNTIDLRVKGGKVSINPVKELTTSNNELPVIFQINVECEKADKHNAHFR